MWRKRNTKMWTPRESCSRRLDLQGPMRLRVKVDRLPTGCGLRTRRLQLDKNMKSQERKQLCRTLGRWKNDLDQSFAKYLCWWNRKYQNSLRSPNISWVMGDRPVRSVHWIHENDFPLIPLTYLAIGTD